MRYLFFSALFLLAGCGLLSPEQTQAAQAVLADLYANGQLTLEQYQALLQALETQGFSWPELLALGGTALGTFAGSVGFINRQRGPAASKAERAKRLVEKATEKVAP